MPETIKAVLFDLDGTLLDTAPDLSDAINHGLKINGLPPFPSERVPQVIGGGIRNAITQVVGADKPDKVELVLAAFLSWYPEHCCCRTRFYPGMEEAVRALGARGYRLGVITNKTEPTARRIIAHFFPEGTFELVWGNNGSRPLKPARDAGLEACRALGLEPEEICFVGDGDTDMAFSRNMGFLGLGAAWGYRSREALLEHGADKLLERAEDLLEILK